MSTLSDYVQAKKKKNPSLRIGSLREVSETTVFPPTATNNPVFDYVTSIGGIPRGLVTEIRGSYSAGKTSICAQMIAQHQKNVREGTSEGGILYLDSEFAVDRTYFQNLGVDVDDPDFIFFQPETLEDGMNMFLELTKKGLLAYCILDSVASTSASAEYEAEVGKMSVGLKARVLNQALRMCVGPMRTHGTGLVLINHMQVNIPTTYMDKVAASRGIQKHISPGGSGIEYYSSLRIELTSPSHNKEEAHDVLTNEKKKLVTSTDVYVTAFKNKLGTPWRSGKMRVEYGKGFNATYSSFHILVDNKLIKKKAGGTYTFPAALLPTPDTVVPRGEDNILAALEENPEWAEILNKAARALVLKFQSEPSESEVVVEDVSDDNIDLETGEVLDD